MSKDQTKLEQVLEQREASPVQLCEWYALCMNPATLDVRHPVLGFVATCQRCADMHGLEGENRA